MAIAWMAHDIVQHMREAAAKVQEGHRFFRLQDKTQHERIALPGFTFGLCVAHTAERIAVLEQVLFAGSGDEPLRCAGLSHPWIRRHHTSAVVGGWRFGRGDDGSARCIHHCQEYLEQSA